MAKLAKDDAAAVGHAMASLPPEHVEHATVIVVRGILGKALTLEHAGHTGGSYWYLPAVADWTEPFWPSAGELLIAVFPGHCCTTAGQTGQGT